MTSPLENLYPDTDNAEPVFAQPGPVSTGEQSHSVLVSTGHVAPGIAEEGELSDFEDQPDRETVRGCARLSAPGEVEIQE